MRKSLLISMIALMALGTAPALAKLAPPKPPTVAEQFDTLTLKAKAGDAAAQYELAQTYAEGRYEQKKNVETAASWLAKAAEGGNAPAQYDLAQAYRLGTGVNPDFGQALVWYEKAADQGRDEAILFICTAYTQDPTVHADWLKAYPYCKSAAAKGAVNAQYAMGVAYAEGRGTAPDNKLALANLQRAADQGHGAALTELGQVYFIGDLVPQNYVESLTLFKKAARRGDRTAVRLMAAQYEQGLGTAPDMTKAARLYGILARDDTDKQAKDWLAAHPDLAGIASEGDVMELGRIPRDVIFYATETNDPRFQTMDIHGYFDRLSETAYPADAQNDGIRGEAMAECRFSATGDFDDCVLVREDPKNYGFGASLMRIIDRLGASGNKTDWARRYEGKSLRISMRWKPE